MDFKEKIDNILKVKRIKLWRLAQISGLNSTLEKAYADNREMTDLKTEKFLQNLGINSIWWENGKGEIFSQDTQDAPSDKNYVLPLDAWEVIKKQSNEMSLTTEHQRKEIDRLLDLVINSISKNTLTDKG